MKKTSAGVVKVKILITRKGLFEKRIISSNFQSTKKWFIPAFSRRGLPCRFNPD